MLTLFAHLVLFSTPQAAAIGPCASEIDYLTQSVEELRLFIDEIADVGERAKLTPPPDVEADPSAMNQRATDAARQSVLDETARHEALIEERGVGAWFGDNSDYYKMTEEERQAWLDERTPDGAEPINPDDLQSSSCIEWVMEHVEAYYEAIGQREVWEEIEQTVRDEDLRGTSLARVLQDAGWRTLYMNADTAYEGATEPDNEHRYSHAVAERDGSYYDVPVDGMVLDWLENPEALEEIEASPFFIYLARGGLHVTAGVDGQLNELARREGPDQKVIYQDPLRDVVSIYAEDVFDGGDDGQQQSMNMWGSGLVLLPPR